MIDCILIGSATAGVVGFVLFMALYVPRIRPPEDDDDTPGATPPG